MIDAGNSLRVAFGLALASVATKDERIVVLDGDLANSTRVDLVHERLPERFLEMGIAEQNMLGVAAGLAAVGYRPWVSSFAAFVAKRSLDQLDVSIVQPRLPVVVAGAYAGLLNGRNGKTHQALNDIGVMRALPHMTVLVPGDVNETEQMVWAASRLDGPVYLRLPRDPAPPLPDHRFRLGDPRLLRSGAGPIAIVSTGPESARALAAAELVADVTSCKVIHLPTIAPLDRHGLMQMLAGSQLVVTVEDHSIVGGLGSLVAELTAEFMPVRVTRIGLTDYGESGPETELLDKYGLSASAIASRLRAALEELSR